MMKKIYRIFIMFCTFLFALTIFGCTYNKKVTKVTPQSQKVEYFKDFEEEKKFMLGEAYRAVEKTGEKPVAWYPKHSSFSKGNDYCAFMGYLKCESGKLASVHIQYTMLDTATLNKKLQRMSDSEISKYSDQQIAEIAKYKSVPKVYASNARIGNNFLER